MPSDLRHTERFVTVAVTSGTSAEASCAVSRENGIALLRMVAIDSATFGGSATSVRIRLLRESGETGVPSCRFDKTFEGVGPHQCVLPAPVTVTLDDGAITVLATWDASGTHSVSVTTVWELTQGARRSGA